MPFIKIVAADVVLHEAQVDYVPEVGETITFVPEGYVDSTVWKVVSRSMVFWVTQPTVHVQVERVYEPDFSESGPD